MQTSKETKPTVASYLLKQALRSSNMTARQLAQKTGIAEGRISNYIHDKHDSTGEQFVKLCNAVGFALSLTPIAQANDDNGIILAQLLELSDAILVAAIPRNPRDSPGTFRELINVK